MLWSASKTWSKQLQGGLSRDREPQRQSPFWTSTGRENTQTQNMESVGALYIVCGLAWQHYSYGAAFENITDEEEGSPAAGEVPPKPHVLCWVRKYYLCFFLARSVSFTNAKIYPKSYLCVPGTSAAAWGAVCSCKRKLIQDYVDFAMQSSRRKSETEWVWWSHAGSLLHNYNIYWFVFWRLSWKLSFLLLRETFFLMF